MSSPNSNSSQPEIASAQPNPEVSGFVDDLLSQLTNLSEDEKLKLINSSMSLSEKAKLWKDHNGIGLKGTRAKYTAEWALQLFPYVEQMIKEPKRSMLFPFDDYEVAPNSLYQYITSGLAYLCEHMDNSEKKFTIWRNTVQVCMWQRGGKVNGVYIVPKGSIRHKLIPKWVDSDQLPEFSADVGRPLLGGSKTAEASNYKQNVIAWIESDPPIGSTPFKMEGLRLSNDQIEDLRQMFDSLSEQFAGIVDSGGTFIKIGRIN